MLRHKKYHGRERRPQKQIAIEAISSEDESEESSAGNDLTDKDLAGKHFQLIHMNTIYNWLYQSMQ